MAFDAFIKIDGIEGECTDGKHSGWIEITDYNSGIAQTFSKTASSAGGATAERANFSEFSFSKSLDKSSPKLALACASGTHLGKITVEIFRAGPEKVKFMEYVMSNAIISSFSTNCDSSFPEDEVAINYGKMEWRYTQQARRDGYSAGLVATGWDLERNCKA